MPELVFEYAIKNENGYYYTGKAGKECMSLNRKDAFTYTEKGAHAKIARCDWAKGYIVEPVI